MIWANIWYFHRIFHIFWHTLTAPRLRPRVCQTLMEPPCVSFALRAFIFNDEQLDDVSTTIDSALADGSPRNAECRGIVLQALMGGGKTSILTALAEYLRPKHQCKYIDCAALSSAERGKTEATFLGTHDASNTSVLLTDNIDYLPSAMSNQSDNSTLTSSPSFTSALLSGIDSGRVFVIATCTNAKAVDQSLLQDYRLGNPVELMLPTRQDREAIISDYLTNPSIVVTSDVSALMLGIKADMDHIGYGDYVAAVSKELALRTQGCSACDIYQFLHGQCQQALIGSIGDTAASTSTASILSTGIAATQLSASQLFQAATQLSPVAMQSSARSAVHGFVRQLDFDAVEPHLVGVENVKLHLMRCISTIMPEMALSGVGQQDRRVRKCSGIVLHGPSGAGKTALTDWLAHATRRHCKFISVPCADLVHKVVGETERKLANIFETARELSPCIVLLDNIDMLLGAAAVPDVVDDVDSYGITAARPGKPGNSVIAGKKSGLAGSNAGRHRSARTRHHAVDRMLSTLLVEIDGIYSTSSSATVTDSANGGSAGAVTSVLRGPPSVLVVVTTTSMNCLDRALIRPGRLEEHIALALPTHEQRVQLFVSLFNGSQSAEDHSMIVTFAEECARYTVGRSYAHIKALYQEANIAFARETLFVKIRAGTADMSTIRSSSAEKNAFVCKYMIGHTKLF